MEGAVFDLEQGAGRRGYKSRSKLREDVEANTSKVQSPSRSRVPAGWGQAKADPQSAQPPPKAQI